MPALPPYFVLAELATRSAFSDLAHSALPDAPIRPYSPKPDRGATRRALIAVAPRRRRPAATPACAPSAA